MTKSENITSESECEYLKSTCPTKSSWLQSEASSNYKALITDIHFSHLHNITHTFLIPMQCDTNLQWFSPL
jgi:hypothetical protein